MKFEELEKSKLRPHENLWRYLDLHKFISFITKKTLFFTRLDLFQDPFEGITTKLIKQRYLAKMIPDEENLNPSFTEEERRQILLDKKLAEDNYDIESIRKQKTQYVSCWFRGERESLAMWNLYSNKDSIALRIEGRLLIEHLKEYYSQNPSFRTDYDLICGPVEYYHINPVDIHLIVNVKYSALKKDIAYNFENEYRLLIATPISNFEENPPYLEIEIPADFFENIEVICHPEMAVWKFQNIKSICRDLRFNRIIKSQIELK